MKTYTKRQVIEMLVSESFIGLSINNRSWLVNKLMKQSQFDILERANKNRNEFALLSYGKFVKLNNTKREKPSSKPVEFKNYRRIGD